MVVPPKRVLVVSHPAVLKVNQFVYKALKSRGWELRLVVPAKWRHEYAKKSFLPLPLDSLQRELHPLPTLLAGRPQRHFYLTRPQSIIRSWRPQVVFLEEEPFSMAATQWGLACRTQKIPFGVQADENLDRPMPALAALARRLTLREASFVAARSPSAMTLARNQGARGDISLIPHHVPPWQVPPPKEHAIFTVGFAGRLVPEKGLKTLVEAIQSMPTPVRLLVAGDGPLRNWLETANLGRGKLRILSGLSHDALPDFYSNIDVLVLPSLTTHRWAEQFGRVLVEALSCGVPVVGSDSGEIPWVIQTTGGGQIFPEGNATLLAAVLSEMSGDMKLRRELASRGKQRVEQLFSVEVVADALEKALNLSVTKRGKTT